jgi:release factor glutamine methyltransferase
MNYKKALRKAYQKLNKNKYIQNPHLDAEILLSKIIKKEREYVLAHQENKISLIKNIKLNYFINKRFKNYPLAYLVQEKEFYAYKFKVNKNTLIPRWESEMIVDEIINLIKNNPNEQYSIFDIGTGTGCIIISILNEIKNINFIINFDKVIAIDISSQSLKIAQKNAKIHHLSSRIDFLQGNLLKPVLRASEKNNSHLIISANLPYLKSSEMNHPTIKHEPYLAFYGGDDGLNYYRELLEQIKTIKKRYKKISLFLEINPEQKEKLISIISMMHQNAKIETKKDLKGLFRLICINIYT